MASFTPRLATPPPRPATPAPQPEVEGDAPVGVIIGVIVFAVVIIIAIIALLVLVLIKMRKTFPNEGDADNRPISPSTDYRSTSDSFAGEPEAQRGRNCNLGSSFYDTMPSPVFNLGTERSHPGSPIPSPLPQRETQFSPSPLRPDDSEYDRKPFEPDYDHLKRSPRPVEPDYDHLKSSPRPVESDYDYVKSSPRPVDLPYGHTTVSGGRSGEPDYDYLKNVARPVEPNYDYLKSSPRPVLGSESSQHQPSAAAATQESDYANLSSLCPSIPPRNPSNPSPNPNAPIPATRSSAKRRPDRPSFKSPFTSTQTTNDGGSRFEEENEPIYSNS